MTTAPHRRACIGCQGQGWIDAGLVDDWPTIAPCPECRPVPAGRLTSGSYRADAPVLSATDGELVKAEAVPRTALWPLAQLAAEAPPGHRLTNPTPKQHPERRNP